MGGWMGGCGLCVGSWGRVSGRGWVGGPFEVALTVLVDRYRGTHGWVWVVCRVVRLRVRSWVGWWAF